jgi:L-malate glycosyltransferase
MVERSDASPKLMIQPGRKTSVQTRIRNKLMFCLRDSCFLSSMSDWGVPGVARLAENVEPKVDRSPRLRSGEGRPGILVLIKGLGLGGAERLLVDALPYLDRKQFNYVFAYLLPWKDFLVSQIESQGFSVHCLGMKGLRNLPMSFYKLAALNREQRFHLIHAHLPFTGVMARVFGKMSDLPVIYTEHNSQQRYSTLTRRANVVTYGWNKRALAVSREVFNSMQGLGLDRKTGVLTLPNGVPVEKVREEARDVGGLRRELGIPPGHLVVGTVAVFRQQKRLEDWLEVAVRVARKRSDVTFLLVGHGPEEAKLRKKVEDLDLADRVRMPGFRPDGRRILQLLDVFLMTSQYEGLPIALLEAMALRKPVAATTVGGIPEAVTHGREGLLASVGSIDELASLVVRLIDDPRLRMEMGQRGGCRVEKEFRVEDRVRFVEDLYRQVLDESSQPQKAGQVSG